VGGSLRIGGDILSQINKIYNTDCIEAMKYIDDEMVLSISEFCKWDITLNIQELWKQYERIGNNGK